MRFVIFKTPKPKRFNYHARFYDEKKEELEKRKAELGYSSKLNRNEILRLKMSRRWKIEDDPGNKRATTLLIYFVYAVFILGTIYVVMFTPLVENFLALFGVVTK